MKKMSFVVVDPVGLHARPATVAVNAASKFKSNIDLEYNGKKINMKSIMGVMSLGVPTQSEITVIADGADEDAALVQIEKVLKETNIIE